MVFSRAEWNQKPPEAERIKGGIRVTRNVRKKIRRNPVGDGEFSVYTGEFAVLSEEAYAAYAGALAVEARRKSEIIDDYTLALIDEGVV